MKSLFSVVIISCLFTYCVAQKQTRPIEPLPSMQIGEEFTKGLVAIYNNSDSKISILIGDSVRMDTIKLKENDYWYSPEYKFNPIIRIQTQNHIVNYQLKCGNTYMIFWNTKNKYWDLKERPKQQ